jgi:hypothetical protein
VFGGEISKDDKNGKKGDIIDSIEILQE